MLPYAYKRRAGRGEPLDRAVGRGHIIIYYHHYHLLDLSSDEPLSNYHRYHLPHQVNRLIELSSAGTFDSALLAGGWNLLSQKVTYE